VTAGRRVQILHADTAALDMARRDELVHHLLCHVDGHSKPDSNIAAVRRYDGGVDTDQLALQIDQAYAGVARVDSRIGLNEIFITLLDEARAANDSVKTANAVQKAGVDIVRRAVQVPARQIAQNAGEDGSLVVGKLLENGNYNWGFNAATGGYQDLVEAGVIDPAKVVRTAL
jgi:TCP-1/cpn60 chaperonin family